MGWFRISFIFLIAVALYFAALNVDAPLLYLLTAIVLSFIFISWLVSLRSLHKMTCYKVLPLTRIFENETVQLTYVLKNDSSTTRQAIYLTGEIQHTTEKNHHNEIKGWIASIPKRGTQTLNYSYRFNRRGKYVLGPETIVSDFPFGIFRKKKVLHEKLIIRVYPEIIDLSHFSLFRDFLESLTYESQDLIGQGDEFYGVREYQFGDPYHSIHWKVSARHQGLMVREMQRITEPRIVICMDTNKMNHEGVGRESTFEYSVKMCASIISIVDSNHLPFELHTQSNSILHTYDESMDYLSECRADSGTTFQSILWEAINQQSPSTTLIILFSGDPSEIASPLEYAREKNIHLVILWIRQDSFNPENNKNIDGNNFQNNLFTLTPYYYEIRKGDLISHTRQESRY